MSGIHYAISLDMVLVEVDVSPEGIQRIDPIFGSGILQTEGHDVQVFIIPQSSASTAFVERTASTPKTTATQEI